MCIYKWIIICIFTYVYIQTLQAYLKNRVCDGEISCRLRVFEIKNEIQRINMLVNMTQYNYDDINHRENYESINNGNNHEVRICILIQIYVNLLFNTYIYVCIYAS
jgi:hypothetical protein